MKEHEPSCDWPRKPCRTFSTDGTYLGAMIAHQLGTTDEKEITEFYHHNNKLTGMPEEQADWEEGSDDDTWA